MTISGIFVNAVAQAAKECTHHIHLDVGKGVGQNEWEQK
jgi:hypothetical protein